MKLCIVLGLLLAVCVIDVAAKCKWTSWSDWSTCTKTCDGGKQYRTRDCVKYGKDCKDSECKGKSKKKRGCNKEPCCEVKWGDWGPWSKCKNCYKKRMRPCDNKYCPGNCKPKKDGRQKMKCDGNCKWVKTGKYKGDCEIDKHGHCVKYPVWECICQYGCHGNCKPPPPDDYERCDDDECCSCDWEKTGEYTDCEIDKHGHCVKYPYYDCVCKPPYCGDCDTPKPDQYELCHKSECCECEWGEYGECKKYKGCQQKRECICPAYCTGECYGDAYKRCYHCG